MIQVNRKTQHYRIYTLLYYIIHAHEKKEKQKDNQEMKREREYNLPPA